VGVDFIPYIDNQTGYGGGAGGHYFASLITGLTTGMAANAAIASLRWGDTGPTTTPSSIAHPRVFVLLNVDVGAVCTTAFGTAQSVDAELIIARSFTASDSGGTQVTAANVSRARATMPPSLVTDLRVATTAGLTAGTRTLDGVGFANCTIYTQNTAGGGDTMQSVYACEAAGMHPVTLTTNEGLIVRVPTAQGASGVIKYYIALTWAEVPILPIA
jgi:hypothetical protein